MYLEGGYWCWDSESCTERVRARLMDIAACLRADVSALFITLLQFQTDKFDMSSGGWKSEFAQDGIFGTTDQNPFASFNKIFVKCVPAHAVFVLCCSR